jgi:hypothetical protein
MTKHDPSAEARDHVTAEPAPADEISGAIDRLARGDRRCSVPREIVDAIDELRQIIARADALASMTDEQFGSVVVLREGDDRRGFKRLAHLVELTAMAVMDASDASDKLFAAVEQALPPEQR